METVKEELSLLEDSPKETGYNPYDSNPYVKTRMALTKDGMTAIPRDWEIRKPQ